MRMLVVNADDFGLARGVNGWIIEAFKRGIVRSTSLMVRRAAADEAAKMAADNPDLGVGLHIDLGDWKYENGEWRLLNSVADCDDEKGMRKEIDSQLERFAQLVGKPPTHLDSHHHVHRSPELAPLVNETGKRLNVPVRGNSAVAYVGSFYGQSDTGEPYPELVSVKTLLNLLHNVKQDACELSCHPGYVSEDLHSSYSRERELELAALTDPRVMVAIKNNEWRLMNYD